jgi:ubiquinone/menaquinone biosynthesis C-methylase UbiE
VSACFRYVVGVDLDMEAMKSVEDYRIENTDFAYGDAMFLPFSAESFDALICSQTYEHVPSDLKLFSEIARVIKKKGIWVFSGPNQLFPFEFHHRLFFLHWLPEKWADWWVRLLKKGDSFYERFRTYWELKRILSNYRIVDAFRLVLKYYGETCPSQVKRFMYRNLANLPKPILKVLSPFTVNFNWILINDNEPHIKDNIVVLA